MVISDLEQMDSVETAGKALSRVLGGSVLPEAQDQLSDGKGAFGQRAVRVRNRAERPKCNLCGFAYRQEAALRDKEVRDLVATPECIVRRQLSENGRGT